MAITYPVTIDVLTNPNSTDTLNSPSHSDQHSDSNDAIEALEAKVGVDSSAVEASHDYKLAHLTASDITDLTASADELNIMDGVTTTYAELNQLDDVEVGGTATGDIVTIDDTQTLTNKTVSTGSTIDANVTVTEVLKKVYPVGSIYINASVSTNPGTLLGFGTWEAFGAGRVMVGKAGSGTFATAGATGGAETHTLSEAEMPTHSHTTVERFNTSTAGKYVAWYNGAATGAWSNATDSKGSSAAHNNLQPYIVVYAWKRTA